MAMNFGPDWMRKVTTKESVSPTLSNLMTPPSAGLGGGTVWSNATNNLFPEEGDISKDHQSRAGRVAYSKDFILGLFNREDTYPSHLDLDEQIASSELLLPLAHIPLSDQEKKLLSMPSINSDSSRRAAYNNRGDANSAGNRSRGAHHRASRGERGSNRDQKPAEDEPWDIPSGIGTFGTGGVFSFEKDSESILPTSMDSPISPTKNSPGKKPGKTQEYRGASSSMSPKTTQMPLNPQDLVRPAEKPGPIGLDDFDDFFEPFTSQRERAAGNNVSSVEGRPIGSNPAANSVVDSRVQPIGLRSTVSKDSLKQGPPGLPTQSIISAPSKWLYRDPTGIVQGPFSAKEMHEWFVAGFFSTNLPVKRVEDPSYEPLGKLVQRNPARPFEAVDVIQSSQPLSHQQMINEQQQRLAGMNLNPSGFGDPSSRSLGLAGGNPSRTSSLLMDQGNPVMHVPRQDSFGMQSVSGMGDPHRLGGFSGPVGNVHEPLANSWNPVTGQSVRPMVPTAWDMSDSSILLEQQRRANFLHQQGGLGAPAMFNLGQQPGMPFGPMQVRPLFNGDHVHPGFPAPSAGIRLDGYATGPPAMADMRFAYPFQQMHSNPMVGSGIVPDTEVRENYSPNEVKFVQAVNEVPLDTTSGQVLQDSDKVASPVKMEEQKLESKAPSPTKAVPLKQSQKAGSPQLKTSQAEKQKEDSSLKSPVTPTWSKTSAEPVKTETKESSKKKRESVADKKAQADVPDIPPQSSPVEAASTKAPWAAISEKPVVSLHEIQEIEAKKKEERDRERAKMAQIALLEQQNLALVDVNGGAAWAASSASSKTSKSLAEIMEEEELAKKARASRQVSTSGADPASNGIKRYADNLTSAVPSFSSAAASASGASAAWGSTNAPRQKPATVVAAPLAKPAATVPAPVNTAASGWSVVGKTRTSTTTAPNVASSSPVSTGRPSVGTSLAAKLASKSLSSDVHVSGDPVSWCRQALKGVPSSSLNAEDFMQILLMMDVNAPSTIYSICDDTLGGYTAIDPRKFADEFIKRRRQDLSTGGAWETVTNGPSASFSSGKGLEGLETSNKFVVVGKKNRKK